MKHLSYLVPHLPQPASPHAIECMKRICEILATPKPEKVVERQAGEDWEEDDAPV